MSVMPKGSRNRKKQRGNITMRKINPLIEICIGFLLLTITIPFLALNVNAAESSNDISSYNSVIEVESYRLKEEYLKAGEDAIVEIVLHNANTFSKANNIVLTVGNEQGMIYPSYGNDNQFFIKSLDADSSTTVEVPITVSTELTGDYVGLSCHLIYETNGVRTTNDSSMILPTQNNTTISVYTVEVSSHATVNGKSLLSISYANKGKQNIVDAVITVVGNVSESTREIELGTIAAEKSYTKDANVIFTDSGDQIISLVLTYTDIDGKHAESDLGSFKVDVSEENSQNIVEETTDRSIIWIGRIVSIIALVCAAVLAFMYIRKR